jgi:hypothetical protein
LLSPLARAQEEAEDEPIDLPAQIQKTERQQERLREQLKLTDERLKLLRELHTLEASVEPIEDELEKTIDDDRRAELEKKVENVDVSIDETRFELEINEQRVELLEILHDLDGEDVRAIRLEAATQLKMLDTGAKLVEELFKAIRTGEEGEVEELEADLGEMEETFFRRWEILQLKVELHYAREEDDNETVGELQRELKELLQDASDDEPDERTKQPRNLPASIRLTESEIMAAAKLDFDKQIMPLLKCACFVSSQKAGGN